jgi:hypothetical protein
MTIPYYLDPNTDFKTYLKQYSSARFPVEWRDKPGKESPRWSAAPPPPSTPG